MAALLNELSTICAELRSEKVATRNKAADRLDTVLSNSKTELIALYKQRKSDHEISWTELFSSAIGAVFKHAAKIDETREPKQVQTLRNKNYVFASIVTKLVDYSLEDQNNFLLKTGIFNAFAEGFTCRSSIRHFGQLFLDLLDRGIYKSETYVRELKVNEFSRILSYLFEANVQHDEQLRFATLRVIIKTIELAAQYVQVSVDLIDYLPQVQTFISVAKSERHKAEVIKLFHLFVSQLAIDYRHSICTELQELLSLLCGFYEARMRNEAKETFFSSIYLSLHAVYPLVSKADFNTFNVPLNDDWCKTLKKCRTIVNVEAGERKLTLYRQSQTTTDKPFQSFVQMAALITYLIHWHVEEAVLVAAEDESTESRRKIARLSDKLAIILKLVQPPNAPFNEIWLAIFAQLIATQPTILNITNFQQVLQLCHQILQNFANANNLRNLSICLTECLRFEQKHSSMLATASNVETWNQIVKLLVAEPSTVNEVIIEKQLLLQALINHEKCKSAQCVALIESIMANTMMRRTECIATVREILIHADACELEKTSEIVGRFITWAYNSSARIDVKNAILNIEPTEVDFVADTCAIAVINFLHEQQASSTDRATNTPGQQNLRMLLYKYNRKFVCIEQNGRELQELDVANNSSEVADDKQNCLLQSNYELLMRVLNFEPSKDTSAMDILQDLSLLQKMICLMSKFLEYTVFDSSNFTKCVLIKRIEFFLSHFELQMKQNNPRNFERVDIIEMLHRIEAVLRIFTTNKILLQYLENQPLEELTTFLGNALTFSAAQKNNDFEQWSSVTTLCFHCLAILCASSSHAKDAFAYISYFKLNITTDMNNFLALTRIFCTQQHASKNIADWFVNKLKTMFKLYHADTAFVNAIVEQLPAIFFYVQNFEEPFQNMLIALISLLKIAYKKSYSTRLTANIIDCVRVIARRCQDVYAQENFTNICLSVAKFLVFPSLEIQFATINTIAALMNFNWLKITAAVSEFYFEFCQKLYEHIEWKNLATTSIDIQQNSNAVTVQILVSLLMFSAYHQEIALRELVYFCSLRKLTEVDLAEIQNAATYHGCTLSTLTKPYMTGLIHYWSKNAYPISKFPYYVCCQTRSEFLGENLPVIVTCMLLYGKAEDLKKLEKLAPEAKLLEDALPIAAAFLLPHQAECEESQNLEYKKHIRNLMANLTALDVTLPTMRTDWRTVYHCIRLLRDAYTFERLFGLSMFYQQSNWFDLSYKSLINCLDCLFKREVHVQSTAALLTSVIIDQPMTLVNVFGALKEDILTAIFLVDKVHFFHMWCVLADLTLDSLPSESSNDAAHRYRAMFFVRDIIFFLLQILRNAEKYELQRTALVFLRHVINKPVVCTGFCKDIIKSHLNEIAKVLVSTVEKSVVSEIEQLSLDILRWIVVDNKSLFSEDAVSLDEFPQTSNFAELRNVQLESQSSDGEQDLTDIIKSFLSKHSRGVEGLKALHCNIAQRKSQLSAQGSLLYELVKQLIDNVRHGEVVAVRDEAAKCLGEIGAIKIEDISYFFQADSSFYQTESKISEPAHHFQRHMLYTVENLLHTFNTVTYRTINEVAHHLVNWSGTSDLSEIFPYMSVFCINNSSETYLDKCAALRNIVWLEALKSTQQVTSDKWIQAFVSKVFESCGWQCFGTLALHDERFADAVLVLLVKLLLANEPIQSVQQQRHDLLSMLEYFFEQFAVAAEGSQSEAPRIKTIFTNKRIISKFLNICECIRIHNNDWKLHLNLLNVAKASNYCQAYFLSIMYLELWALEEKSSTTDTTRTNITIISNEGFQVSAKQAYESIDCCDAIAGFINPSVSRLDFLNLNNQWPDILLEATTSDQAFNDVYKTAFKRNGMFSLANYKQSAADYEAYWRLGDWSVLVENHSKINSLNDMEQEFQKHHYNAIKCLFNREKNNSLAAISKARECVISIMREISTECLQSIYKYLTWLQLLQQADDFCQVEFSLSSSFEEIFDKWRSGTELHYGSFQCKEQVLAHQITLFKTAGIRATRKIENFYKDNPVESCLLKCIKECRKAGKINLARRNIATLRDMNVSNELTKLVMLLEDADICLETGKYEITQSILQHVLTNKSFHLYLERVRAFLMQGEFLMESNTEKFENVLKNYFMNSLKLLDKFVDAKTTILERNSNPYQPNAFDGIEKENRKDTYAAIAKYADREYVQLNTYINSDEFQMRCQIIQQNREAAESVSKQNKDRDKNIGANFLKRYANLDEEEIKVLQKRHSENLCIAVEHYMHFCRIDDTVASPAIYRIIALWFANKFNEELLNKIVEHIPSIPSYKFICALNQITARLTSNHTAFLKVLKEILVRCVEDHPHQTLYQLYSLVYAFSDGSIGNDRVSIGKEIITKARNKGKNASIMKQLESMIPVLIEFANVELPKGRHNTIQLSDKLMRLKNLTEVQCPTVNLPIAVNKQYSVISVVKWEALVTMVGGINAPKKLMCLCSDGRVRPQLLKGKDDLRQDAVMQQVFSMFNDMLRNEPEAVERKLMLRTYKVVPLSMRSGILEWCENSIPIGAYLFGDGKSGAHKKYRPSDYTIAMCRQYSNQHAKSEFKKRYEMFAHICAHLKPVFHYFLFEKFLVPGMWFERRLAYTNSVATTSIVGYILGLGDRHTQNILIDEKTAEVIHIDFGIAFEQGRIMPTPEMVPFRLTRDMIAPMGVCETNGVFKKSCEATMRVLRGNQAVIMPILEVLLYDPLYLWKVVPQANADGENNEVEEKNLLAQRALLAVQNKLDGRQSGILGSSDVHVQVQRLINEALSNHNLCLMFSGWDAYC